MEKERNLVVDTKLAMEDIVKGRKTPPNSEFIRTMTPIEWERLQGFPDNWTMACRPFKKMKQLGNAVIVPVIKAISINIVRELANTSGRVDELFS